MVERRTFGAKEICTLADISLRQLGYWKLIGIINPREEVRENKVFYRYSDRDLQVLKAIKRLTKEGYLVSKAAERIKSLLDTVGDDPDALLRAMELPPAAAESLGYFQRRLKEEIGRSRRFDFPISCIAIRIFNLDPQRFKDGVPAIERILRASQREYDVLAQVDRAEFIWLLPQTGEAGVKAVAARVCRLLAEREVLVDGRRLVFEAVLGTSTLTPGGGDSEAFIDTARRQVKPAEAIRP